jgi:hypothetical protein
MYFEVRNILNIFPNNFVQTDLDTFLLNEKEKRILTWKSTKKNSMLLIVFLTYFWLEA